MLGKGKNHCGKKISIIYSYYLGNFKRQKEETKMRERLIKVMQQCNQLVNIMYVEKEGSLTKWNVKVIGILVI